MTGILDIWVSLPLPTTFFIFFFCLFVLSVGGNWKYLLLLVWLEYLSLERRQKALSKIYVTAVCKRNWAGTCYSQGTCEIDMLVYHGCILCFREGIENIEPSSIQHVRQCALYFLVVSKSFSSKNKIIIHMFTSILALVYAIRIKVHLIIQYVSS